MPSRCLKAIPLPLNLHSLFPQATAGGPEVFRRQIDIDGKGKKEYEFEILDWRRQDPGEEEPYPNPCPARFRRKRVGTDTWSHYELGPDCEDLGEDGRPKFKPDVFEVRVLVATTTTSVAKGPAE